MYAISVLPYKATFAKTDRATPSVAFRLNDVGVASGDVTASLELIGDLFGDLGVQLKISDPPAEGAVRKLPER